MSLRLRHASLDVGAMLEGWGLEVGRAWIAGVPRNTPRGGSLPGVNRESYAYTRIQGGESVPLRDALSRALEVVAPFSAEVIAFVEGGGRAELFVAWKFEQNSGHELSWRLLGQLAEYRLDLSLDIYPEVEPELKDMMHG